MFIGLHVTERARNLFHRAGDIARRTAKQKPTDGQVFELVVTHFFEREDERLCGLEMRRVPSTWLVPGARYVPAAVRDALGERSGRRCEVGGCSHRVWLELMQVGVAHTDGGAREVPSLAVGCSTHHVLHDAGVIRFGGWMADGHSLFRDSKGRVLGGDDVADPARRSAAEEVEAALAEAARAGHAVAPEVRERAFVTVPDEVSAEAEADAPGAP